MICFSRALIYRAGRGTKLDDPEFSLALQRAEQTGIEDVAHIQSYPFQPVRRTEAAQRYVLLAQDIGLVPSRADDDCVFGDIDGLPDDMQDMIILSCQYGFFKGTDGSFHPELYVTKANSLVALMRALYPATDFAETDPYRTPYAQLAYEQSITQRPSGPYMMYLITRYEMLLQLYRVYERKK